MKYVSIVSTKMYNDVEIEDHIILGNLAGCILVKHLVVFVKNMCVLKKSNTHWYVHMVELSTKLELILKMRIHTVGYMVHVL